MKIIINDKQLSQEEIQIVKDIFNNGVEFQKETYNMAKDIALSESKNDIDKSLDELVNSDYEKQLIYNIINGSVDKLLNLFK
jgi:hypothetical protein